MANLIFIAGDQLSEDISALDGASPADDIVFMAEVAEETKYVPHHRQKIVLILAAMRHFAKALQEKGFRVDYVRLDSADNSGSFTGEIARAIVRQRPTKIVATWPGEWRVLEVMRSWQDRFGIPIEIREDDRFVCSRGTFARWAGERTSLRMEFFYREMRRTTGLLMEGEKPQGGAWNFDAENRKSLPRRHKTPVRRRFPPDAVTSEVIELVARRFPDRFGSLENFGWPVTRAQALDALDHFITACLPFFGDYQDAMRTGDAFLHHSLLSAALNIGLLKPLEICAASQRAFHNGKAPLNAVEGFIRQIIGWREYVRGLYWTRMPDYAQTNALEAQRALPAFYWTAQTDMACMRDAIGATRDNAYAHHIQRLMITGNFALLAGIAPAEIEAWYLAVYVDAFEWVELPNTHGMAIFADGGVMASKPYAASGAYINRMSDYCGGCQFDVKKRTGAGACPFNFLYWDFLMRNEERLQSNPRMAMPYKNLDRLAESERRAIVSEAKRFLDGAGGAAEPQQAILDL